MPEKILDFIADYHREHGFPPTVREIGKAVGLSSSSTVHFHLQRLEGQGKLTRVPGAPRTLMVKP
jgi:repressor LexA